MVSEKTTKELMNPLNKAQIQFLKSGEPIANLLTIFKVDSLLEEVCSHTTQRLSRFDAIREGTHRSHVDGIVSLGHSSTS